MTATTIRRATDADAADVAAMVREIALHEGQAAHVHVDEDRWRELLTRPEVIVLVAERDGIASWLARWPAGGRASTGER